VKFRTFCLLTLSAVLAAGIASTSSVMAQTTTGQTGTGQQQPAPPPPGLGPRVNAQQQQDPNQPPQPNVETVATHSGWVVQCGDIPAQNGQPASKACGMTRAGNSDKDQKIGITLIVKRLKGQDGKIQTMMDAWAPIGVYLPTGVAMEIDGTALDGRMSFTRCIPRACNAFGEATDVTLKKFAKGKAITFYIYDRPGNGYPVKFPLQGFADGLADLDKYLPDVSAAAAAPAPADPAPAVPKKK
jgi:invasion protein IalB